MTRDKILMETIRIYHMHEHEDFGHIWPEVYFIVFQESEVTVEVTRWKAKQLSELWKVDILEMKKPQ